MLTINIPTTGDTTAVACDIWYGTELHILVQVHIVTINGFKCCDSVVTLNLTINNASTGDTTAVACDSLVWYGNTYTSTGTYTDTLQTTQAVIVVTLNLTINNSKGDILQ